MPAPWPARRLFPLLATVALITVGMMSTTWGPRLAGHPAWAVPDDLWGTLVAARRLLHLDLGGLYTRPTGLLAFPGAAVILVPVAALIDAAGTGLAVQGAHNPDPGAWLLAGPYEIALSGMALFAADAIAERLGAARWQRALLAAAGAVALWNVSVRWGHPEDAVAVALLLYGILALSVPRTGRAAWLIGAAVAVQPLVLLAVPVILAFPIAAGALPPRRLAGFLARAAIPAAALLAVAAVANWHATVRAVTSQPNWPAIDHTTPWTAAAPHAAGGGVAAGPARMVAILVACGCALLLARRWRRQAGHAGTLGPQALPELLWWVAVTLAIRCALEPVMVAFYLWPALAVALLAASADWSRLIATSLPASAVTFASQAAWHGPWIWWGTMVAGLGLTLLASRPAPSALRFMIWRDERALATGPCDPPAAGDPAGTWPSSRPCCGRPAGPPARRLSALWFR